MSISLMNQKIKDIEKFRREGFALREISKELNIPYSTVKRYSKHIKMSDQGLIRYHSKVNGVTKLVSINPNLTEEKIRIIANLLFDGAVYLTRYHYSIMYVNSSKDLINQFMGDMELAYKLKPSSFEIIDSETNTYYRVKYLSKAVYMDLLKYLYTYSTSNEACFLPKWISDGPQSTKIIMARAFWENEGSISKDGKLSADLKSLAVMDQLSKIHNELGLSHYVCKYTKMGSAYYKLILNRNSLNYTKFVELELFSKANVAKGHFKGMKKLGALKAYCLRRNWL